MGRRPCGQLAAAETRSDVSSARSEVAVVLRVGLKAMLLHLHVKSNRASSIELAS